MPKFKKNQKIILKRTKPDRWGDMVDGVAGNDVTLNKVYTVQGLGPHHKPWQIVIISNTGSHWYCDEQCFDACIDIRLPEWV